MGLSMRTTSVAMCDGVVMNIITQPCEFFFAADGVFPEPSSPDWSFVLLLARGALLNDVGWVKTLSFPKS